MNPPAPPAAAWHVLGAGAMGCLWAARIWQWQTIGGAPKVCLMLRDQQALDDYTQAAGLILESGEETLHCPVPAELAGQSQAPIDNLLLATKAHQAAAALEGVSKRLTPATNIVLLQNGVRSQRQIAHDYGGQRVFCMSTSHGAYLDAPFQVIHSGFGEAWLGQFSGPRSRSQALLEQLPAESMNLRLDDFIAQRLWYKFAINCAINALTVVHDCRNGELLEHPLARQQLPALCLEIEAILAAVPGAPLLSNLLVLVETVLRTTAANVSSTLQDVRRGRPTELPELNGYLCELAAQHQMACPLNDSILQQALARQSVA